MASRRSRRPRGCAVSSSRSALGLVLAAGAASVVYACIRWSPGLWWLPAGLLFALALAGLTNLAPVLVLPLFYSVRPLGARAAP